MNQLNVLRVVHYISPGSSSCYVFVVIYHDDDTQEDSPLDIKVDPPLDNRDDSSFGTTEDRFEELDPSLHPHTTAPSYDDTLIQACSNVFCHL